jgi:tetratricopeptide (TPR) repeat protein
MPRALFLIAIFSLLLSCKGGDEISRPKTEKAVLSEKAKVSFGRIYIDATKEKILGNFEKAIALYQEAIKIDPTSAAAHFELGLVYNATGNEEEAFVEFEIANQLDPKNYWYKLSYATFLENQGEIDKAIVQFKELVEENPTQVELKYELAKLLLNQGKAEEGIEYLNLIQEDIGVEEEISFLKQRIYLSLNDVDKAAAEIEVLIDKYPRNSDYYAILTNIYISNEREEDAVAVLERMKEAGIEDSQLYFTLAKLAKGKGDQEAYLENIKLAFRSEDIDIDEKVKFLLSNYQVAENQKEELNEAIELAQLASEAHPEDAKAFALLADFLYFADRNDEAIDAYRKTISIDSSRFPVWNQMLIILSESQESELLLNYAERSIQLFPNQPSLYFIYGLGLYEAERYEDAVEYLELGKDLVIDNQALKSQFYSSLGDIYHELNNHEVSDQNYEMALKLDPNNIYVLNNYSYYLSLRKENLEKAKEMSLKSNQISPGQASFQDTYAWILYQLQEYDKALEWINKAIDSDRNASATLFEHKGDILYKLDKKKEALEYWKKAKAAGGASDKIEQKIQDEKLYE